MEVSSCRSCGKLFNKLPGQLLCPTCQKELDGKFKTVKQYVYDNPGAGISQIAKECGVSPRQINRWIREERLTFSDDSPIGIECEGCGVTIKTGRFCNQCKSSLGTGLKEAAGLNRKPVEPKKREATTNKMRFLDSDK